MSFFALNDSGDFSVGDTGIFAVEEDQNAEACCRSADSSSVAAAASRPAGGHLRKGPRTLPHTLLSSGSDSL